MAAKLTRPRRPSPLDMTNNPQPFRILVPCDYSEASRQALDACAKFEWHVPVEVFILTVDDPMRAAGAFAESHLAEWLNAFPATMQVRLLQERGRFVTVVLDAVATQGIDLVVVGTRGARGWEGVFMGSHAERIVRVSPVPVLAIQRSPRFAGLRNIVVPIDIDRDPAEMQAFLTELGEWFSGRFYLLYINTDPAVTRQAASELLAAYDRKLGLSNCVNAVVHAEDVVDEILKYASLVGADMIAMGTLGDPDPAHMFRPSIAADVVNHGRIPVLAYPLRHRRSIAS